MLDVDTQNQRISLGMKQLATDPWEEIDRHFRIGDVVQGKISKITNFGAFVELKDGIDVSVRPGALLTRDRRDWCA